MQYYHRLYTIGLLITNTIILSFILVVHHGRNEMYQISLPSRSLQWSSQGIASMVYGSMVWWHDLYWAWRIVSTRRHIFAQICRKQTTRDCNYMREGIATVSRYREHCFFLLPCGETFDDARDEQRVRFAQNKTPGRKSRENAKMAKLFKRPWILPGKA